MSFAQSTASQENINSIKDYLINNPDDMTARLNLGYNYMLDNKPMLALREYRFITEKDSTNLQAWMGMLWAYNTLKNWKYSLANSKIPLKLFPQDSALLSYTAFAYWNSFNAMTAHKYYSLSLKQAKKDNGLLAQSIALEGLGWIYLSYNDYSLAHNSFQQAQVLSNASSISSGMESLKRFNQNTILSYSNLENKKTTLSANQCINYKRLNIQTGFEQFKTDGKRIRDAWSAGVGFQTKPFLVGISGWSLNGKTTDYPVHIYQTYITEKYWFSDLLLQPTYRFAYSEYPEFNAYQNDLAFSATYLKTTISAGAVRTQRDVENLNADASWWAYHAKFSYPFNRGYIVSLSAGKGKQDWWVSPVGFIVDTNVTNIRYLGNTISIPCSKTVDIIFYHQLGYKKDIWHYTGSLAMNVSY